MAITCCSFRETSAYGVSSSLRANILKTTLASRPPETGPKMVDCATAPSRARCRMRWYHCCQSSIFEYQLRPSGALVRTRLGSSQ
ncbi:hypothetical protein N2W54_000266 [Lotmaria passim]